MFRIHTLAIVFCAASSLALSAAPKAKLSRAALEDKIRGGWTGKAWGVAYGGPTEFRWQGRMIEGPLALEREGLNRLAGQDDMYVNMALLKALADHGLGASREDFAKEFAYGGFLLWHANGQGRQNLLAGIAPDRAGHPYYSPHADDIDFQIEADFIGLVSPGLPQAAEKICDRAGHLMNYGDGYHGGVFVTAMYAAAFVDNDVNRIVENGIRALPPDSGYARILRDVQAGYKKYPSDWKATWRMLEEKWNHDKCPWGANQKFNISASLNGAYIALGLLYGQGDFLKTVEIATRAGQDSDCNPANAGGVVGTMLGFEGLPASVRADLKPHMDTKFDFAPFSLNSATKECLRLAMENIKANGGRVTGDGVEIAVQAFRPKAGPTEVSFPSLKPVAYMEGGDARIERRGEWVKTGTAETTYRAKNAGDSIRVKFEGTAIYVQGDARHDQGILEYLIDGKTAGTRDMYLPKQWTRADQSTAVWVTGLADGPHTLEVRVTGKKNPQSDGIGIGLGRVVSYRGAIAPLP
ncbi:MAG: ADP-ribosylglycohydrolase family protein [Acidobacteriota bacterium]